MLTAAMRRLLTLMRQPFLWQGVRMQVVGRVHKGHSTLSILNDATCDGDQPYPKITLAACGLTNAQVHSMLWPHLGSYDSLLAHSTAGVLCPSVLRAHALQAVS